MHFSNLVTLLFAVILSWLPWVLFSCSDNKNHLLSSNMGALHALTDLIVLTSTFNIVCIYMYLYIVCIFYIASINIMHKHIIYIYFYFTVF